MWLIGLLEALRSLTAQVDPTALNQPWTRGKCLSDETLVGAGSLSCCGAAIRSAGSAVLWIYSTLMLQFAVPNELLGRVLALEMALFTVSIRLPCCMYTLLRLISSECCP